MKIGLLTHYLVNNQGAQLQMYCMCRYLEGMGHEVYILTYKKNFDFDKVEEKKNSASILQIPYYVNEYLIKKGLALTVFNTKKVFKHKKALKNYHFLPYDTDEIDAVIIGSDEVFSIDVGCNKMMYGHQLKVPAIAYAPSFGRSTVADLKNCCVYDSIEAGLSTMYQLSARDMHTQLMIRLITGRSVPKVCDPVMLYNGTLKASIKPVRGKYLLVYAYDCNMVEQSEISAIRSFAKKHKLITVSCGTYHKWCDENIACNAIEWYSYFMDASYVVTDTFHGAVVAIKNHRKVAVYIRKSINAFKLQSLMEETGLTDRILSSITFENMENIFKAKIDYEKVDYCISRMRTNSEGYLLSAIRGLEQ